MLWEKRVVALLPLGIHSEVVPWRLLQPQAVQIATLANGPDHMNPAIRQRIEISGQTFTTLSLFALRENDPKTAFRGGELNASKHHSPLKNMPYRTEPVMSVG